MSPDRYAVCTAPRLGHRGDSLGKASCPVHGPRTAGSPPLAPAPRPTMMSDVLREALKQTGCTPAELADDLLTTADVLERLAEDSRQSVRSRVAANPSTPPEMLAFLARDEHPNVRLRAADNPHTPLASLAELGYEKDASIASAVAANPAISAEDVAQFAKSSAAGVRAGAASNSVTHAAVLEELARDRSKYVRIAAAGNANTPEGSLRLLSSDGEFEVRKAVARNPSAPAKLLEDLETREQGELSICVALAGNPSIPDSLARHLSGDGNHNVRSALVENSNVSDEVAAACVREGDESAFERGVNEGVDFRIRQRFGIDRANQNAVDVVRQLPWWTIERDDSRIQMTLAVHRNR